MATRFYKMLFPHYDNHALNAVFQRLDGYQLHKNSLPFGIFRSLLGHIDLIDATILNALGLSLVCGLGFSKHLAFRKRTASRLCRA